MIDINESKSFKCSIYECSLLPKPVFSPLPLHKIRTVFGRFTDRTVSFSDCVMEHDYNHLVRNCNCF